MGSPRSDWIFRVLRSRGRSNFELYKTKSCVCLSISYLKGPSNLKLGVANEEALFLIYQYTAVGIVFHSSPQSARLSALECSKFKASSCNFIRKIKMQEYTYHFVLRHHKIQNTKYCILDSSPILYPLESSAAAPASALCSRCPLTKSRRRSDARLARWPSLEGKGRGGRDRSGGRRH